MGLERAYEVLKEYFGYSSLREGQDKIIENILLKKDVVGIMPTGAGKSICFQIPALIFDGITVVISPLISLMKDQVNTLSQAGVKAAYLNSSLSEREYFEVLENIREGFYKIIYVAPERLLVSGFIDVLMKLDVSMVTIDEAHCISQWGQDFRPSYMQIVEFIRKLEKKPVISAFTATATSIVKDDIISILKLENPYVLITGFDRSNLYFEVQKPTDKMDALNYFLKRRKDECGIIYCLTRENVEKVCSCLCENGYEATRYHAGLSDRERRKNQDDFIYDRKKIVVATNAFGMGIDKSNVSFVVHFNMPKDMESYYQEAGRAGRDGNSAHCLILYGGNDVRTNLYMIENSKDRRFESIEAEQEIMARDRERLKIMSGYCHTRECLRKYILNYFGENTSDNCENCGNCMTEYENIDITVLSQKIISCIIKTKERFGINMVIAILRGSKNKRILDLYLDRLSTYGIVSESEAFVKDTVNDLIMNEYLYTTNDEYPILKIGKHAGKFLKEKTQIFMKTDKIDNLHMIKGTNSLIDKRTSKNKSKKSIDMNSIDLELLGKLKALRLSLAVKQNVPAFVVFSDSTLIDMCLKMPKTENDFLEVSGVGAQKLERYGAEFLGVINGKIKSISDDECSSEYERDSWENEENKHSNSITVINAKAFDTETFDEPVTVSVIADQLNLKLVFQEKKISAIKLNNFLIEMGYLEIIEEDENKRKSPTKKGLELGITNVEKKNFKGQVYYTNYFNKNAQEFIIKMIDKMI